VIRAAADLVDALSGGDRRSIGNADAIAAAIAVDPALFAAVVAAIAHRDSVVRMRAADAAEKASRSRPGLLAPHKSALLRALRHAEQKEVRWHLLQMLPRLDLTPDERRDSFALAARWLDAPSRIVAAEALTTLFALAATDPHLKAAALAAARRASASPSPALRARARFLMQGQSPG
jgi:hypothetical protein